MNRVGAATHPDEVGRGTGRSVRIVAGADLRDSTGTRESTMVPGDDDISG